MGSSWSCALVSALVVLIRSFPSTLPVYNAGGEFDLAKARVLVSNGELAPKLADLLAKLPQAPLPL